MLLGQQCGLTKYCSFHGLRNNRETNKHYIVKDWPLIMAFTSGKSNVKFSPLIDP